jgi:uncharacterized protein YndB with AHSA1/START domain
MARHKTLYTNPDDRTLRFERVFDAPRALVWEVWTDPKHLAHWWGPEGFTLTDHGMAVKPGGTWSLTLHGPDGVDWPNHIEYLEVRAPEFLAYDHGSAPGDAETFRVTAEFIDLGNRTKIVNTIVCRSAGHADEVRRHAEWGHESTWNRLEAYLEHALQGAPGIADADKNN